MGAEGCETVIWAAKKPPCWKLSLSEVFRERWCWWGGWAERADTNHLSQLSPLKAVLSVRGWFITQTETCVHRVAWKKTAHREGRGDDVVADFLLLL